MTDTNAAASAAADTTEAAPLPGSPEYDTAMAAKWRESQAEQAADTAAQPEKPTRPDNVPEKFWDPETGQVRVEDLLKSYTELEKGKQPDPQPDTTQTDAAAQEAAQAAGLNWDDLGTKITAKGDIEASDYEALAKVGITKELVQDFIAGRQARQELAQNAAYEYGGGKEAVDGVMEWAGKNLTADQIAGYNQMLSGPSWQVALDTLKSLHAKATGSGEPNLEAAKGLGGGATLGYQSQDEMTADMANPLYNDMGPKGAVFRSQVQEKVRLAKWRR